MAKLVNYNLRMDRRRQARTVVPATPITEQELRLQARWEHHPNRLDKEGVDTLEQQGAGPLVDIPGLPSQTSPAPSYSNVQWRDSIDVTANARFGYGGKQFVARLTGLDPKYIFSREFIGKKGGKRGEFTTATIIQPGYYMARDIDSKGRSEDYYFVAADHPVSGLKRMEMDKDDVISALKRSVPPQQRLAQKLIQQHRDLIGGYEGMADTDIRNIRGTLLELSPGDHTIAELRSARLRDIAILEESLAPAKSAAPVPPSQTPKEPWEMTQREWAEVEPYRSKQGNAFRTEGRPDITISNEAGVWERRNGFWNKPGTGKGPFPGGIRATDPRTIRRLDHQVDVAKALSEGKPVPPEVLAEYPDLAKSQRGK